MPPSHPAREILTLSRTPTVAAAVLGFLVTTSPARADHFAIDLEARDGKASQTAHAEAAGRGATPKPRKALEARAGDSITVRWKLRNTDPKSTSKDVLVHFVAVKEEKAGQAAVPKLDKGVLAETALTMDFRPRDAAEGEVTFVVREKGPYLVRLETIGASVGLGGHEDFAALDLIVR